MIWFLLTLSCIILWGITDILLKKSLDYSDSLSQYKTFIWIGLVAALSGTIAAVCSDTLLDSIRMLADNLYLVPVTLFYVVAMFFGLLGAKHLDASVVSPLENIDGAVTAIILYMFFEFTGRSHVSDSIGIVERIGTATCLIMLQAAIKRKPCPNSKICSKALFPQLSTMLIQMPILLSS